MRDWASLILEIWSLTSTGSRDLVLVLLVVGVLVELLVLELVSAFAGEVTWFPFISPCPCPCPCPCLGAGTGPGHMN